MSTKVKVTLTPEQETLLITLYAKAQPGNPLLFDPTARDILNRVDYDFARLHVPYKTVVLVCQRAKKVDRITQDSLREHPGGVVVQLGDQRQNGLVIRVVDQKVEIDLTEETITELLSRHLLPRFRAIMRKASD